MNAMTQNAGLKLTELLTIRNAAELAWLRAEADVTAFLAAACIRARRADVKPVGDPRRVPETNFPTRVHEFVAAQETTEG